MGREGLATTVIKSVNNGRARGFAPRHKKGGESLATTVNDGVKNGRARGFAPRHKRRWGELSYNHQQQF